MSEGTKRETKFSATALIQQKRETQQTPAVIQNNQKHLLQKALLLQISKEITGINRIPSML